MTGKINESALGYWRHSRYSSEDIDTLCREIDYTCLAARVLFRSGGVEVTVTNRIGDTGQGHAVTVLRLFQRLASKRRYPDGALVLWLEDGLWDWHEHLARRAPLLTFGRRCWNSTAFLIPDPSFLGSDAYAAERENINAIESGLSWDSKQPTVFWRGSGSGLGMNSDTWQNTPRMRLCRAAKELNDPARLDAKISNVVDYGREYHSQRVHDIGVVGGYVPFEEFLKYRYLVDADGECCAWVSLFTKLASQSLVVKIQSEYEQWYHRQITPWVHYVPLKSDLSDLNEVLDWLSVHDDSCRAIAAAGADAAQSVANENWEEQLGDLVGAILACQNR